MKHLGWLAFVLLALFGCTSPKEQTQPQDTVGVAALTTPPVWHVPPRINVPDPARLERIESAPPDHNGYSAAVLPIKTSTTGMRLTGKLYVQTGGRELMISYGNQTQIDCQIDNCGFRCTTENLFTKWLDRRYNVTGTYKNSFWKMCPVEHAIYLAPGPGDLSWTECLFQNIAGSAIQLRLATSDNSTPPEQSQYWLTERRIFLDRVVMLECSTDAGRGAFSFSPKSPGPNTDLEMIDCFIQTKNQTNVDGKGHDSFGGCCFETMRSATLRRCTIELKNPANAAIQAYEYDSEPSTSHHRAPVTLTLDSCIIANNVDVRVTDTLHIDVSGCTGGGTLRLWKPDPAQDKWVNFRNIPIAQGYHQ
jgi:hypothetical protein